MSKSRQLSDAINSVDISESAPADAVTLDASGNLLVGKTASGTQSTVDGIELREAGFLFVTKSNDAPAYFHRRSSDGDIVQFRKDGTTVGSIGVADSGDRIYLAGGGLEGVGIDNGANAFVPTSQVGAFKDGHLSLGRSDARFTNLYLSGGVYLGGTGAANYLDDYEYGTWTPVLSSAGGDLTATYNGTLAGEYVKIGRFVFCSFALYASSISGGSGNFHLGGLPFTSSNSGVQRSGGPVLYNDGIISKTSYTSTFNIAQNVAYAIIRVQTGTNINNIDGVVLASDVQSGGGNLQGSFSYVTS